MNRRGKFVRGKRSDVKKAFVSLKEGDSIPVFAAAEEAGEKFADHALLRLPQAVAPLFEQWLAQHLPAKKDKILSRIRAMRRGKLNNSQFGLRMSGEGVYAGQIEAMFAVACRKAGLDGNAPQLSAASFRPCSARQLSLFQ